MKSINRKQVLEKNEKQGKHDNLKKFAGKRETIKQYINRETRTLKQVLDTTRKRENKRNTRTRKQSYRENKKTGKH